MKLAQYFFITATLADRQVSPQATATIKEIGKCAMWFRHAQEWTAALEKKEIVYSAVSVLFPSIGYFLLLT